MKSINEMFSDSEFRRIKKAKGSMTWHEFILFAVKQRELGFE